jgi:Ca2+-binding RTX toxin-like protein
MRQLLAPLSSLAQTVFRRDRSPTRRPVRRSQLSVESLEDRNVPSVFGSFNPATGALVVTIDNDATTRQNVTLRGDGGFVWLTERNDSQVFDHGRAVRSPDVRSISVTGSRLANFINLSYVDTRFFYGLDRHITINGGDGNDTLWGSQFSDVIHGGNGNDHLAGWDGNDDLYGDSGDDVLDGVNGNDRMTGGPGLDTFRGGPGTDWVTDYHQGEQYQAIEYGVPGKPNRPAHWSW